VGPAHAAAAGVHQFQRHRPGARDRSTLTALLSDVEAADRLHGEAIHRLGRTRVRAELARAHLLYGEGLRRENRRTEAREQLRISYQMLTVMGMEGSAERACRELLATGETARKRTVETLIDLTAQEAQIATLARDGRTNQKIAAQLFISPRAVEWHLGNVFTELGITSRKDLRWCTARFAGATPEQYPTPSSPCRPLARRISSRGAGSATAAACRRRPARRRAAGRRAPRRCGLSRPQMCEC
jgi:DNA-binding CsgD family transcriptional regulator